MPQNKHCATRLIALVMTLGLSASAVAIERLGALELLSVCSASDNSHGEGVSPCSMYVQGFFAGMKIYGNKPGDGTSFQERALKTRAGSQLNTNDSALGSDYCLPEDTTMATFVGRIQAVDQSRFRTQTADQLIRSILNQHYLCRQ